MFGKQLSFIIWSNQWFGFASSPIFTLYTLPDYIYARIMQYIIQEYISNGILILTNTNDDELLKNSSVDPTDPENIGTQENCLFQ